MLLWPFMETFPSTEVTSLDILPHRIEFLKHVKKGGISLLNPELADITEYNAPNASFDVVTFLETLEHIPELDKALLNAVRLAKRAVILSLPTIEDDNPDLLKRNRDREKPVPEKILEKLISK